MPWTAQVLETETYAPNGPSSVLWGEQVSESEVYTKNERFSFIYSNDGERVFTLDVFPTLALFADDSLWLKQGTPTQPWE